MKKKSFDIFRIFFNLLKTGNNKHLLTSAKNAFEFKVIVKKLGADIFMMCVGVLSAGFGLKSFGVWCAAGGWKPSSCTTSNLPNFPTNSSLTHKKFCSILVLAMAYIPHPQRAHCGLPPMLTETLATADLRRRRQPSKSEIGEFSLIRFRRNFRQSAK